MLVWGEPRDWKYKEISLAPNLRVINSVKKPNSTKKMEVILYKNRDYM